MFTFAGRTTLLAFLAAAAATPVLAGDGNTISILQDRTFGAVGNTLTVDQSKAAGSIVRGPDTPSEQSEFARQLGSGNSATLTIEGKGGEIQLLQDNRPPQTTGSSADNSLAASQFGAGNSTTIDVIGDNALATVEQIGLGNQSDLSVAGNDAAGAIFQNGLNNQAGLKVSGTGANGKVTQNGNNNETGLEVIGAGTSVDYTLNGNNVTNLPDGVGGVQVFTNGATVTITQTTFR